VVQSFEDGANGRRTEVQIGQVEVDGGTIHFEKIYDVNICGCGKSKTKLINSFEVSEARTYEFSVQNTLRRISWIAAEVSTRESPTECSPHLSG
jgi:hypothetical protein